MQLWGKFICIICLIQDIYLLIKFIDSFTNFFIGVLNIRMTPRVYYYTTLIFTFVISVVCHFYTIFEDVFFSDEWTAKICASRTGFLEDSRGFSSIGEMRACFSPSPTTAGMHSEEENDSTICSFN